MQVLVVANASAYVDSVRSVLRSRGYIAIDARTSEEALVLSSARSIGCVVLDASVSGIGVDETCRRFKADVTLRHTPLVVVTEEDDGAATIRALGAGADDCCSKTAGVAVLMARVDARVRRQRLDDERVRVRDEVSAREVDRKNEELERFSYSVSHDLRAPLRSIDGFSQALLEDHAAQLDDKGREHLRRVRAAAQRMGALIDGLVELSRIGRAEMRREHVDLSGLARGVVAELRESDDRREVDVSIADAVVAHGDPRLLRIVLESLLGNAWKFTQGADHARIELGASHEDDKTTYFIQDNGAGFDMQYAAKLFAPFQRLHAARDFPGTGIGLATARRVVERHGGRITAEGAVGRGARISWSLASSTEGAGQ